tara:strand:+ start:21 stop:779 length:759 start_codon:yes stop_codon:yes gene_type:complete
MNNNIELRPSIDTIKRLTKDIKDIQKNPLHDNGIYYIHDDENIMIGHALIIGPKDTPYENGFYFFDFLFPNDYPHNPPTLTFMSNGNNIRFNPNLYRSGKVCISILNTWRGDQWTCCQTISTILLTLCTVLNDNPLLNEPGILPSNKDIPNYNNIIRYENVNVCIVHILKYYILNDVKPYFLFKDICCKIFNERKDSIIKQLQWFDDNNIIKTRGGTLLKTSMYGLSVNISKKNINNIINEIENLELNNTLK